MPTHAHHEDQVPTDGPPAPPPPAAGSGRPHEPRPQPFTLRTPRRQGAPADPDDGPTTLTTEEEILSLPDRLQPVARDMDRILCRAERNRKRLLRLVEEGGEETATVLTPVVEEYDAAINAFVDNRPTGDDWTEALNRIDAAIQRVGDVLARAISALEEFGR